MAFTSSIGIESLARSHVEKICLLQFHPYDTILGDKPSRGYLKIFVIFRNPFLGGENNVKPLILLGEIDFCDFRRRGGVKSFLEKCDFALKKCRVQEVQGAGSAGCGKCAECRVRGEVKSRTLHSALIYCGSIYPFAAAGKGILLRQEKMKCCGSEVPGIIPALKPPSSLSPPWSKTATDWKTPRWLPLDCKSVHP